MESLGLWHTGMGVGVEVGGTFRDRGRMRGGRKERSVEVDRS